MSKVITVCLVCVGIINFLPLAGVLSSQRLEDAYGIAIASDELAILMRHRALLFGIVGGFILYSAFMPYFQTAAMIMAGVSMIGFIVLAHNIGGLNGALNKVVIIDYLGVILLAVAVTLKFGFSNSGQ